jgi:drug/metabolite transporter (DMT)-like permease
MFSAEKLPRIIAIAESILANLIWASTLIFVKGSIDQIAPLTFAGLRFFIGFLVLLPFVLSRWKKNPKISGVLWARLWVIGLSTYTFGNGALFWAMKYLSATTASLLLSFLPILVMLAGVIWLNEKPTRGQLLGMLITIGGCVIFFSQGKHALNWIGLLIMAISILSYVAFSVVGRAVARDRQMDTLTLTAIPLGLGSVVLLMIALPLEGIPTISLQTTGVIIWLAVVNTAIAYVIYYHSLQQLTAFEQNVIFNISPLSTVMLAWIFLGERISSVQIAGMFVVVFGVFLVQQLRATVVEVVNK